MNSGERATNWTADAATDLIRNVHDPAVTSATWLASGHWSDCFGFVSTGANLVVRVGHHIGDFLKDQVAQDFAEPDLPIPAVLRVGTAGDHSFAISERVQGEPLEQAVNWHNLVIPLANTLEALRSVDVTTFTGWGRWNSDRCAPSPTWRHFLLDVANDPPEGRMYGWKQRLAESATASASFDRGFEQLCSIASDDVGRAIVHNDLLSRNVHVAENQIIGVFDWGNSLIGDHLYDMALATFWQPWLPRVQDRAVCAELRARWQRSSDVVDGFDARFASCLLHIGLEHIAYNMFLDNKAEADAVCDRMEALVRPGETYGY